MKKVLAILFTFILFSQSAYSYDDIQKIKMNGIQKSYKMKTPNGNLYSASQPVQESFKDIKNKGIKTVLNLRTPTEMNFNTFDEEKTVKDLGMSYLSLPITPQSISKNLNKKLTKILSDKNNYPIFIHCSSANRVATVLAIHDILNHNESYENAIHKAEKFGLTKDGLKQKIKDVTE